MPRRNYPPANPARLYQQYPLEAGGGGAGGGADLADYYTKAEADGLFPKKAGTETISGLWTFTTSPLIEFGGANNPQIGFHNTDSASGEWYMGSNDSGQFFFWENDNSISVITITPGATPTTAWKGNVDFTLGDVTFVRSYSTASGYNYPFYSEATQAAPSTGGTVAGAFYAQVTSGSGTVAGMYALEAYVASQGAHTITDAYGLYVWGGAENVSSVITNWYGAFLTTPDITGTITNKYGFYADNYGTTGYPIYTNQGIVSIGDRLALRDNTQYPVDSVLYKTSGGTIAGSGAAATGDLLFNIDGSAWTSLAIGTEGYVLKSVSGIPTWSVNNASDADTLDGQHGTYYLSRSNHTGTQAVTTLEVLPDGNVIIGDGVTNAYRVLTGDDIDWSSAFGAAATQIYLDGATSSFRSSLGLYAGAQESTSINYTTAYLRGQYVTTTVTGQQGNYQYVLSAGEDSRGIQFASAYGNDNDGFWIRRGSDNAGSEAGANAWQNWKQIATAGMTDNFTFGGDLYLSDATTYPTDSLLYRTSSGQVVGSGASATGDLIYNIDGSAWTPLAIGTEGYVLKVVSGLPAWSTNAATDADTLDGQHGTYYLARANHTGTQAVTTLTAGPDDTFLQVRTGTVQFGTLDAADIDAGEFPGASYSFAGELWVDNDFRASNASNTMLKVVGTLVEIVATSDDSLAVGGWARGLEWNGGGAAVNASQIGTLGSADTINYVYISADGTSGTSDYNSNNTWRWLSGGSGIMWMGGTQPEIRLYESDAPADEKYWRIYAAAGNLGFGHMSDASAGTDLFWTIYRNGNDVDYMQFDVDDIRLQPDGSDAQYFRFYSNGSTGQTHLEFRRGTGSSMVARFTAQASTGDFYLSWYGLDATLRHHWLFADASTDIMFTDGIWEWQGALHGHIYDNGTIGSGATLNVDWDNGNSQRCAADTGNITIAVDGASMRQGTAYTIQVINISTTASRTVTWSGVDSWVGGTSPTAAIQQSYGTTVVQLYTARAQAGTDYVIGSVILDDTITPS